MIIGFLGMVVLFGLGMLFSNPSLFMTLSFRGNEVYLSVFTLAGGIVAILWFWHLILQPFYWIRRFSKWREKSKQEQKQAYLSQVLEALVNQNKERYPLLVKQASTYLTEQDPQYWTILALLQPSEEVYQKLLTFPTTMLGGIHGFFEMAEDLGNLSEMRHLLDTLSGHEKEVLWVKRAYLQLALMEGDWAQVLVSLEGLKKQMSRKEYKRQRACCLLMMGQVDEAYQLDETQAPIVLAKAKENPEKAIKILKKSWEKMPCQEVYTAYKKALSDKTEAEKIKAVLALTKVNKGNRFSLLALADMNLEIKNAIKAKEILDEYLENYPLTQQVAVMMATAERMGWNHEELAQDWEKKALDLQEKSGWVCTHCGHISGKWEPVCSACHLFNSLMPN